MSELLRRLSRYFDHHLYEEVARETATIDERLPEAPQIWKFRGLALQSMGDHVQAIECFEKALAHLSGDAHLHSEIAECSRQIGNHEQAHRHYRCALDLDPLRVDLYHELLSYENLAPNSHRVVLLLKRIQSPDCSEQQRANILFLLGRIHVAAGQTRRGFEFYRAGNDLMPHTRKSGRSAVPDLGQVLCVDAEFLAQYGRPAVLGGPSCPVILVVGLPRSGKSLVEKLLSRFPGIVAGGELAYAKKFVSDLQSKVRSAGQPARQAAESVAQAMASADRGLLIRRYRHELQKASRADSLWVVDTSPATLYRLGLFSLAFPEVPIIFCTRDPMDLGVSIYFKKFRRGHEYSYNLETLGETLAVAEIATAHWKRVLRNPWMEVRYEDLVNNPLGVVDRINTFMRFGLSREDMLGRFGGLMADTSRQICHPSHPMDHLVGISPAMVGYAKPFLEELGPMRTAYRQKKGDD